MVKMIADQLILDGKCTTAEFWSSMDAHTKVRRQNKKNLNLKKLQGTVQQ